MLAHDNDNSSVPAPVSPCVAPKLYCMRDGTTVLARSHREFVERLKGMPAWHVVGADDIDSYMESLSEVVMEAANRYVRYDRGVDAFVKDLRKCGLLTKCGAPVN